jgi:DNA-binding transcriptional MerR regulator/effector-binding domain-containing protein
MFRIGEFSQIARVSGRLLRYYDSIGLLTPQHTDEATGYRYYSADQLPRLNRILALKHLGLSLDEIARLIDDKVPVEEIRRLLAAKRDELQHELREGALRLRHIESRLAQLEDAGTLADYDIVLKSAPAQPYLSVRASFPGMEQAVAMLREVTRAIARGVPPQHRENLVVLAYSDFEEESELDLEMGVALTRDIRKRVDVPGRGAMEMRELPSAERLATVVRSGTDYRSHQALAALGTWMEANRYRIAGPCREVFLELPFQRPDQQVSFVEIQFPVTQAA